MSGVISGRSLRVVSPDLIPSVLSGEGGLPEVLTEATSVAHDLLQYVLATRTRWANHRIDSSVTYLVLVHCERDHRLVSY